MKWTKFSSGTIPVERSAFITDEKEVWIETMCVSCECEYSLNWTGYRFDNPNLSWSEIELPEVPKKELHRCYSGEFKLDECFQENAKLIMYTHGGRKIEIKFCPFCGYSIKENE